MNNFLLSAGKPSCWGGVPSLSLHQSPVVFFFLSDVALCTHRIIIMKPLYFAIEGPVAAGKTEILLAMLQNRSDILKLPQRDYRDRVRYFIKQEPVEMYRTFTNTRRDPLHLLDDVDLLELSYTDPEKYAFESQSHILNVNRRHYQFLTRNYLSDKYDKRIKLFITERCPSSSQIFIDAYHSAGIIDTLHTKLLDTQYHNLFCHTFHERPNVIIYLDTPWDVCRKRCVARARPGETHYKGQRFLDHVHRNYLSQIRRYNRDVDIVVVPPSICTGPKEELFKYIEKIIKFYYDCFYRRETGLYRFSPPSRNLKALCLQGEELLKLK